MIVNDEIIDLVDRKGRAKGAKLSKKKAMNANDVVFTPNIGSPL